MRRFALSLATLLLAPLGCHPTTGARGVADGGSACDDCGDEDAGIDAGIDAGTDAGIDAGIDAGTDACGGCAPPQNCSVIDENGDSACVCPRGTGTCDDQPCATDLTTTTDCGACGRTCSSGEQCSDLLGVGPLCSCDGAQCPQDATCLAGACLPGGVATTTVPFGLGYAFDPRFFGVLVFPVCAGAADDVAAGVACAELGTPSAAPAVSELATRPAESYGPGIVAIHCAGDEAHLQDCALVFGDETACPDPGVRLECP